MKKKSGRKRVLVGADGVTWVVEGGSPTHSNVMLFFRHPDPGSSRMDRYAWYQWRGPEARMVNTRLDAVAVLETISDDELRGIFRRSMPVSRPGPSLQRVSVSSG